MIHQWKKSLLEGAAGIFEPGGKAAASAEIAEDTVRDLHTKIGDLSHYQEAPLVRAQWRRPSPTIFWQGKLKPWIRK